MVGIRIITNPKWQLEPKEVLAGIVLTLVLSTQIALLGMLMEIDHKLEKLEGKEDKN